MPSLIFLLLALPEDPAALIERLGSERVEEREHASRTLKALGAAALPELDRHADHSDPEIRARVRGLLRVLRIRESLPPSLLAALPGLDEFLERGGWREALRASHRKGVPQDRAALAVVIRDIALRAGEFPAFCNLALELDYRPALPALRSLQFNEIPEIRSAAQKALLGLARKATLSGTTLVEQRVAVPVDPTVNALGHPVQTVQAVRLAMIEGKVYEEGDVLAEFGVRIHRIRAHGIELRALDAPPQPR